jgi:hypothetical protein
MRHFSAAQRGSMTLLCCHVQISAIKATGNLQPTDCNVQIATYRLERTAYGMVRTCQLKSMHLSARLRVHLAQK